MKGSLSRNCHKVVLLVSISMITSTVAGCGGDAGQAPATSTSPAVPEPGASLNQSEHAALEQRSITSCLKEKGWDVSLSQGNVMDYSIPQEQEAKFRGDMTGCRDAFLAQYPRPTVGVDDWRRLYQHNLWLVECLEREGYPPVQEPPSEAAYLDQAKQSDGPEWTPYAAVDSPEGIEALHKRCPPEPQGW